MLRKIIMVWVLLMAAGTFAAGCSYVGFQQLERSGADMPAVMAAKQAVYEMDSGKTPQEVLPATTNGTTTITPFVLIYDSGRKLICSSLICDTGFTYPAGCFDQMDKKGENRVTWQPSEDLRFATVGIKYGDEYVVGAYSLEESEEATSRFSFILILGWAAYAAIVAGVATLVGKKMEGIADRT